MAVISHISITILPRMLFKPIHFSSTRTPEVDWATLCTRVSHRWHHGCDAPGEEQSELLSFMRQFAKPNKTQILLSTARYNISFVLQTERHSHGSSSHTAEDAFYPGEKGVESAHQSVPPVFISFPRPIHSSPNAQDTCITTLLLRQPAHLTSTSITFSSKHSNQEVQNAPPPPTPNTSLRDGVSNTTTPPPNLLRNNNNNTSTSLPPPFQPPSKPIPPPHQNQHQNQPKTISHSNP